MKIVSRINNPHRMKQLIDFKGLNVDGYIYPTDIDGLIEYKDSEYILFEIKYGGAEVPFGQKLAIQRMVDDFTKVGKQAVAFVCEHTVKDVNKSIVAAQCKVREIYYGKDKQWKSPNDEITVIDAVNSFQEYSNYLMRKQTASVCRRDHFMSKKIENRCVDCGLPCLGRVCPNNHVPVYYCDDCENEGAKYHIDGYDLCEDCARKKVDEAFDNLTLLEQAEAIGMDFKEIEQ